MRIGIVGPAERAVAWEQHIRPHRVVNEVAVAPTLQEIGDIDACILLHAGEKSLDSLLDAIKMGFHTFLVSRLPKETEKARKIYHAAEESNVRIQFSHWPTLSPMFQWMKNQIAQPDFIHISREIDHAAFMEMDTPFEHLWIDELALCLKWVNSSIFHIDAHKISLSRSPDHAIHIHLRFENGTVVGIWVNTSAESTLHRRRSANASYLLDCNVAKHTIRFGRQGSANKLFFEKKAFEDSDIAKNAATRFLKSIQLKQSTPFNGYDALKVCTTVDNILSKLS